MRIGICLLRDLEEGGKIKLRLKYLEGLGGVEREERSYRAANAIWMRMVRRPN